MPTFFKTLKKHNVLIVKNPFIYIEKHKSGTNKGKAKQKRQVRYVEHLDSLFVDEQVTVDPQALATPIYIKKGIIKIDDDNQQLIDFFKMHEDNEENGGRRFKEVNVENEELYELQKFEAIDSVKHSIMKANENTLRTAAVFFLNPSYLTKSISTIKLKLRQTVDVSTDKPTEPTSFVAKLNAFFDEKNNNEKLLATIALSENIIQIVGGKKMAWMDSGEVIYVGSQANDVIKDFAVWLKNDEEGRQMAGILSKKIDALKKEK